MPALRAAAFHGGASDDGLLGRGRAGSPPARWLTAVVLGAGGRYGGAAALLEPLTVVADPVVASLACSTLASHRRQLGGHADARRWDAAALRRLGPAIRAADPDGAAADPDGVDVPGALADALLGLAADALGRGRLGEARTLIGRAEGGCAGIRPLQRWRARVRHGWVSAEVELAVGRPTAARPPAEAAADLARQHDAPRHALKSDIVLAVALATASDELPRAERLLSAAWRTAAERKWHSLTWPAAFAAAQFDPDLREYADAVLHGVLQRADPVGRQIATRSPWVPSVLGYPAPGWDADIWAKNFEKKATGSCQGGTESVR